MPSAFIASLLLGMGGFTLSAALTALGLMAAYRSGMRVWIGEGVNRARTLLMGMLVVGFTFVVLGPLCIWLDRSFRGQVKPGVTTFRSCWRSSVAYSLAPSSFSSLSTGSVDESSPTAPASSGRRCRPWENGTPRETLPLF